MDIVVNNLHKGAMVACEELIQTAALRWQEEEGDYRDDVRQIVFEPHELILFDEIILLLLFR